MYINEVLNLCNLLNLLILCKQTLGQPRGLQFNDPMYFVWVISPIKAREIE